MNYTGGKVALTGAWQKLADPGTGMFQVTVRNAPSNAIVYLSPDGVNTTGYLDGGEAKTFKDISYLGGIWVKGTLNQFVYWDNGSEYAILPQQDVDGTVIATQGTAAAVAGAWPVKVTDGTDTARVSPDGALATEDRMLSIAEGGVTGHSLMLKFGRNPDIDTGAAEDVWEGGGLYTFDTTAQSLEIVSSSASDAAAGTGAQTVTVIGLDANYEAKSENVTMNGVTAVPLTGTWMRVHRCSVTTAGTGEVNAGTLTVRIAGAGATRLVVGIGNGQTLMAIYTIPAATTGYLYHYYVSGNSAPTAPTMDVTLWTRSSAGVRNLKHQQALSVGMPIHYTFAAPFKITEKTDIWLRAMSTVNNTDVCGGFDIVLVTN